MSDPVDCNEGILLTPQELSDLIGISVQRLSDWRGANVGFPYYKIGEGIKSAVRYASREVAEYMQKYQIYPSNEASAKYLYRVSKRRRRFSADQIEKLLALKAE